MSNHLDWLYARQRFGVHPGLGRVRELLNVLGDPQTTFQTVLVGGTNGKGSTAATLASILQSSGQRTALFTSPHLTRFAERFMVGGQELSADVFEAGLGRVRPHAEALGATFFEIVVALGCWLFAEAGAQWAVMEVGLGGRLDATNALEPALSVITGVALDHTEILGDTLSAITSEKAGILRSGRLAVTGIAPAFWPLLDATGADVWALGREAKVEVQLQGWQGSRVTLISPAGSLTVLTPLLGQHGAMNAALAVLAAQRLGTDSQAIQNGVTQIRWPGRLEKLTWLGGPDGLERQVVLDGAHNPDGARALAAALRSLGVEKVPLIFGAAGDKDIAGVVAELAPIASQVILTRSRLSPRAAEPQELAKFFEPFGIPIRSASTPAEALASLPPGLSVVCGSLYLLGEVRPLLLGEAAEERERWQ
ncbi:bifunctional folylpolyglutamate synthase/dihydrofolate synthase [Deinococcus psychrotolerans]|uniref:tetrahydrofolate synthase n=1 Tax=Deinococcus psychrotolerans TaxID=2489213 RepID=A0A3G8YN08_9DEIO|nr:folylpolyglutamate synthase/dihydrofolate synthase family protein [Deinococcus psychrotolerans]AZI42526.1 bifunctional folylpolyglutamate synthase/dihydrofolate synthase [Deinococcus psychrotolerans]